MPSVSYAGPLDATGWTFAHKVARPERRPIFRLECICYNLLIPHFFGHSTASSVEHGTTILCSLSAYSIYFEREPVIQATGYGAATNGATNHVIRVKESQSKLTANRGVEVPVV